MIPAETVPAIRGGGLRRAVESVDSSVINLIHCKNLCKFYNVPPPSTTINNKKVHHHSPFPKHKIYFSNFFKKVAIRIIE
jgi:hypothetical protein